MGPISTKITLKKQKRKKGPEEKRKKNNGYTISFYLWLLWRCFLVGKKKLWDAKG